MKKSSLNSIIASSATTQLQLRRLGQIIFVITIALSLVALQNLLASNWRTSGLIFGAIALLAIDYCLARAGRLQFAAALLMVILTAMATALIWLDQGLHDHAMLGYCGILIFAGVLGGGRMFLLLLGFMLTNVMVLGVLNVTGLHVNEVPPLRVGNIIDASVIIAAVGFGSWLLASDLRRALRNVEDENQRVLDSQHQVEHLARHDPLTGLANRLLARDRFDQALELTRRNASSIALLFLDLDNFKTVNDSLGHTAGDELLCQVAERLQTVVRSGDTVSRQGGDEFLLALSDVAGRDAAASVAVKVLECLSPPFSIVGQQVLVSCSLGVALGPDDGDDFETLLKKADMAMYKAKDAGRNAWRFYDDEMSKSIQQHLLLAASMRGALIEQQFELHYQPQFELATGRLIGAEALIRWNHPELGRVSPATFIPIAEKTGLIIDIGAWVLHEACQQAKAWHALGYVGMRVSVNLSPVQFRRGDVERVVVSALETTGLPASALELELTESLFIDDAVDFSGVLHRLRDLGVSFSIDDFGTGYSNLGYLKRFEVEVLKIDQSFIRRLIDSPQDEAIVQAITQMAHSLKLLIVAEGIEDVRTLKRLVELGCDRGQGFFWAPGLPAEAFSQLLNEHAAGAPVLTRADEALFDAKRESSSTK